MPPQLGDVIAHAHHLLAEVLQAGDLAVDLTAGRGRDTLFLARQVNTSAAGTVVAIDIQRQAISASDQLLRQHSITQCSNGDDNGVWLCCANHAASGQLLQPLCRRPRAVIANFGYLPGGDHNLTTTAADSVTAVAAASELLLPGGRIALVLYTGHVGAAEECHAIEELCATLAPQRWNRVRLQPLGRNNAPYLLALEKR